MNVKIKEVRDPKTHRLQGIYRQEDGIFESKQKGRIMRINSRPAPRSSFSLMTVSPQRNSLSQPNPCPGASHAQRNPYIVPAYK